MNSILSRTIRACLGLQHRGALLEASDFLTVTASGVIAWTAYCQMPGVKMIFWPDYAVAAAIAGPLGVFIFRIVGCYSRRVRALSWQAQAPTVAFGLMCFGAILLYAAFYTRRSEIYSRGWMTIWFVLLAAMTLGVRALYGWIDLKKSLIATYLERVAIVGAGEIGEHVFIRLTTDEKAHVKVIGVFDDRLSRCAPHVEEHVRGTVKDLVAIQSPLDAIIVAFPFGAENRLDEMVRQLRLLPAKVLVLPGTAPPRYLTSPLHQLGTMPVIRILAPPLDDMRHVVKLLEDRILGLVLSILVAPIVPFVIIAIKLDSSGPILFRQERRGFQHNLFTIYKFRTMHQEFADLLADRLTVRGDTRVTRVGRWLRCLSIDEIPQLLNVLQGNMSLVGPRPHPVNARAAGCLYHEAVEEYAVRYRILPGITGWAQVHGWRGATETVGQLEKRVEYDLYYIDNWSLMLDIKILLLTVLRGFWHPNAY